MSPMFSSWLSGPESTGTRRLETAPGERLGLPPVGPGSPARMGRRLGAFLLDWLMAVGLAGLLVPQGVDRAEFLNSGDWHLAAIVIWLVLGVVAVRLFGFTPGQYACGLRVIPVDGTGPGVGVVRAVVRGLLIALVVPALFTDVDGRGLQDRATATAVVRSR